MIAMRTHILLVGFLLVSLGLTALPGATAERLEAYTLVGDDPEGDATHYLVTGVGDPSGLFTPARLDILGVEMGTTPEALHVKLNIGTTPAGTSGYMYRVVFMVGEDTYFTCWNTQWFGGQHEEENVLGCSRFADGTQVGPGLKGDGVDVDSVDGVSFVRWEVPRGSIGDAVDGTDVTGIFAETWVRGVSNCCAGSQTGSQYLWNRGDLAPDEGVFAYALGAGGAAEGNVTVTLGPANQTVAPGATAATTVTVGATGGLVGNATLAVDGLPDGWTAAFDAEAVALNESSNVSSVDLAVQVPADAPNGTYVFPVTATLAEANLTASANLTIVVDGVPMPQAGAPLDGNATDGNGTAANVTAEGGGLLPAPGFLVAALIVGGAAAVTRHRRNLQKP